MGRARERRRGGGRPPTRCTTFCSRLFPHPCSAPLLCSSALLRSALSDSRAFMNAPFSRGSPSLGTRDPVSESACVCVSHAPSSCRRWDGRRLTSLADRHELGSLRDGALRVLLTPSETSLQSDRDCFGAPAAEPQSPKDRKEKKEKKTALKRKNMLTRARPPTATHSEDTHRHPSLH